MTVDDMIKSNPDGWQEYFQFVFGHEMIYGDRGWYCESHHVFPVSLFPTLEDVKPNIVRLKYENHIVAHRFLAKLTDDYRMKYAFSMMMKDVGEYSTLCYGGWSKFNAEYHEAEKKHPRCTDMQLFAQVKYEIGRGAKSYEEITCNLNSRLNAKGLGEEYFNYVLRLCEYASECEKQLEAELISNSKQAIEYLRGDFQEAINAIKGTKQ